jgi:SAM-dependent methyltransferase
MHIYKRSVDYLLKNKLIEINDSILIVAGGEFDRNTFYEMKFLNVTISNLEPHANHTDYSPYNWERLDAEEIDKPDNCFDWVFIHAGLHHLGVPAKGVCEMFRIARKGILCIEARDNILMRSTVKLGLTSDFELEPAYLSGGSAGGYRNGPIPNYVYRWTEREFEKVVNSYAPTHEHKYIYLYDYGLPIERLSMAKNPAVRSLATVAGFFKSLAKLIFPRQGNQFAFCAIKNHELQPWLNADFSFKNAYLESKYDKNKYVREES